MHEPGQQVLAGRQAGVASGLNRRIDGLALMELLLVTDIKTRRPGTACGQIQKHQMADCTSGLPYHDPGHHDVRVVFADGSRLFPTSFAQF
jgi:hypothetical protein